MSHFHLPSVVKCPSCDRTNGVPTSGGVFECMFCGAPIDLNKIAAVQAPRTSRDISTPTFFQPKEESLPLPAAAYTSTSEDAYDPGSDVLMTYAWRRPASILGLLGSIAYLAFVVFFFGGQFFTGSGARNWLFTLVGLSLMYGSLSGMYRSLAQIVNTTTLRRREGSLVAVHRPLPWGGAQVKISEIRSIVVEGGRASGRNRSSRQDLAAALNNKRKVTLIPDVKSYAEAQEMANDLSYRLRLGREQSNPR